MVVKAIEIEKKSTPKKLTTRRIGLFDIDAAQVTRAQAEAMIIENFGEGNLPEFKGFLKAKYPRKYSHNLDYLKEILP